MAANSPFIIHRHKQVELGRNTERSSFQPPIPDLRFEYSYLRSIRPYVQLRRSTPLPEDSDDGEYEKIGLTLAEKGKQKQSDIPAVGGEIIDVQWNKVLWVTTRDQVISPLLQGALWALASYFITPFFADAGRSMGTFVRTHLPSKEGLGISWLRNQLKQLRLVDTKHS
ncbi:hypothetical protein BDQ17DRAFT_1273845 [Cyathus striatus]|nr:hypothetical protein BDQ17DRAFT_1273845 [Cyathus striatus]